MNGELWAALASQWKELNECQKAMKDHKTIILSYDHDRKRDEAMVAKSRDLLEASDDIQLLRNENLDLFNKLQAQEVEAKSAAQNAASERSRLIQELESCKKATADAELKAKDQAAKDTQSIKELEEKLEEWLDEIIVVEDRLLVPSGLGADAITESRLSQILQCGELWSKIFEASQALCAKFFSDAEDRVNDMVVLPKALEKATDEYGETLWSAARGGAKTALGLMMAHYPDAKIWRVTKAMPESDGNGTPLDKKAILRSVSRYATRVADMVKISTIFKRVPVPSTPKGESSGGDEDKESEEAEDAESQPEGTPEEAAADANKADES